MNETFVKFIILSIACVPLVVFSGDMAGKNLSAEEFLQAVRRPSGRECWAKMEGTATNKRTGMEEPVEAKIHLGILFTPERTVAKLTVNGTESYDVGQSYAPPYATSVDMKLDPESGKPILGDLGLRPQDLTMTFIYWDCKEELGRDSVKGQPCRVFMLESPDKSETARVHISAEYLFPLKVEWFKTGGKSPDRTLETVSFKRERDFWLLSSLKLYGPGWMTKVEFEDASAGFSKDGVPADLFAPKSK